MTDSNFHRRLERTAHLGNLTPEDLVKLCQGSLVESTVLLGFIYALGKNSGVATSQELEQTEATMVELSQVCCIVMEPGEFEQRCIGVIDSWEKVAAMRDSYDGRS